MKNVLSQVTLPFITFVALFTLVACFPRPVKIQFETQPKKAGNPVILERSQIATIVVEHTTQ